MAAVYVSLLFVVGEHHRLTLSFMFQITPILSYSLHVGDTFESVCIWTGQLFQKTKEHVIFLYY